jgi:hypothetical protein
MLHFVDDDPDYLGWVSDHPPYRDSEQVLHGPMLPVPVPS